VAPVILAAIFLSERVRPVQLLGGALILAAAYLAQRAVAVHPRAESLRFEV
jgi:drug/metabolite transporter (DMT)-like permease